MSLNEWAQRRCSYSGVWPTADGRTTLQKVSGLIAALLTPTAKTPITRLLATSRLGGVVADISKCEAHILVSDVAHGHPKGVHGSGSNQWLPGAFNDLRGKWIISYRSQPGGRHRDRHASAHVVALSIRSYSGGGGGMRVLLACGRCSDPLPGESLTITTSVLDRLKTWSR